jgi:hypothetical protein
MAVFRAHKVVAALPGTLTPDTVYAVRTGAGFDLYISDATGSVAHKINSSGPPAVPTFAASDFVIPSNTQGLFAEPIQMPPGSWIEVQAGAVLRQVN